MASFQNAVLLVITIFLVIYFAGGLTRREEELGDFRREIIPVIE